MRLIVRLALFGAAISLIVWSVQSPRFYDSQHLLGGTFAFPFSAGMALVVLAFLPHRTGLYIALGLLGHAALLQTIDAGKRLHYQHYRPFDASPVVVGFLSIQAIIVLIGLWKHRRILLDWVKRHRKAVIATGLLLIPVATAVSEDPRYYLFEIFFASFAALIQAGNLFLIVRDIRPGYFTYQFHSRIIGVQRIARDRFPIFAGLWVTAIGILLALFVYERHPHVNDEVAYLFQARILATGSLTVEAPPIPEAFELYLFQYDHGRLLVVPPPGWPAVLAVGVWLKAPWIINPLLAGFNILLAYFILTQIYDRLTARLSLLLLCFSPWFLFMSMNFMTHQWSLTCALVSAAGVIQARRTGKSGWALVSGLFIGIQSLIRPLDGLLVAIMIGLWSIGCGGKRLKFVSLIALVLGTLLTGSFIFPYNQKFTDDPFRYPINAYNEARHGPNANAYGFGKDHGMGWALDPFPGHGPLDAMVNAQLNTSQIHIELFGWGIGSLCLIVFFILSKGFQRKDYAMYAVLFFVFVAYFFYYYSGGPDFGARYWFLMLVPLIALTVRGADYLQSSIERGGVQVFVGIVILSLFTLINYIPWRSVDKYHRYLYMSPEICSLIPESASGDLVLVSGAWFPDYSSAMACNPLDFRKGNPIFARERGEKSNRVLEKQYPERNVWIVDGPTKTGASFEITSRSLRSSVEP